MTTAGVDDCPADVDPAARAAGTERGTSATRACSNCLAASYEGAVKEFTAPTECHGSFIPVEGLVQNSRKRKD